MGYVSLLSVLKLSFLCIFKMVTKIDMVVKVHRSTYLQTHSGRVIASGRGHIGPNLYQTDRGRVYDTTRPPPQPCYNCEGMHWRKDCPYGLSFEEDEDQDDLINRFRKL